MNGFYMTLPSNSSMIYHPGNKLSQYTTRLPQSIHLTGKWEVGLVEIQYPHTWYNVKKGEVYVEAATFNESDGSRDHLERVELRAGFYGDPGPLCKRLNRKIQRVVEDEGRILFEYDNLSNKVEITTKFATIRVSEKLRQILGFDRNLLNIVPRSPDSSEMVQNYSIKSHPGDGVVDMAHGFYSMYVYCDIVEDRIVGDSTVPLLRNVPIEGKHGDIITRTYENIHYLPVQKKMFDTLEINIRDDTGVLVPFERGKVTVTLHFRKRSLLA